MTSLAVVCSWVARSSRALLMSEGSLTAVNPAGSSPSEGRPTRRRSRDGSSPASALSSACRQNSSVIGWPFEALGGSVMEGGFCISGIWVWRGTRSPRLDRPQQSAPPTWHQSGPVRDRALRGRLGRRKATRTYVIAWRTSSGLQPCLRAESRTSTPVLNNETFGRGVAVKSIGLAASLAAGGRPWQVERPDKGSSTRTSGGGEGARTLVPPDCQVAQYRRSSCRIVPRRRVLARRGRL